MLCYRDMTFCADSLPEQGEARCTMRSCHRYWTEEHSARARAWWSHDPDNAPVAFASLAGGCPDYQPKGDGDD